MKSLSKREIDVVRLVALGKADKIIAFELGLTTGSVKQYGLSARRKLEMSNRTELAAWFWRAMAGAALLCLLAASLCAADGVVVATTVTATAGTGATGIVCTMSAPALPAFHAECRVNAVMVLTMDTTPAVGTTNGAVGAFTQGANSVTWLVQQPTGGSLTWQIAANGSSKSGTF